MSIAVTTDVMCDRCSRWSRDASEVGLRAASTRVRKRARRLGWRCDDLDLCPACVKDTAQAEDLRQ